MAYVSQWLMSATDCNASRLTPHARLPKQHVKSHVETTASGIPANDPFEPKTGRVENRNRILAGLLTFAFVAVIALISAVWYRQLPSAALVDVVVNGNM